MLGSVVSALTVWLVSVVLTVDCQLYQFRMIRSPGSVTTSAVSLNDCANKCRDLSTCSAVSFTSVSRTCLLSLCNNVDFVRNNGWHSMAIALKFREGKEFPGAIFEWQMTDCCSTSNQGKTVGPDMNYVGVRFEPTQSVHAGFAVRFSGEASSCAVTNPDRAINNALGKSSMSYMLWVYWADFSAKTKYPLLELHDETSQGLTLWLVNGALFVGFSATSLSGASRVPWTPSLTTWHHLAFVYNATAGEIKFFADAKEIYEKTTNVSNKIHWNFLQFGSSVTDDSMYLNGRVYCVKLFDLPVNATHIAAIAESCYNGKARLS